jgi:hypothetical protein
METEIDSRSLLEAMQQISRCAAAPLAQSLTC